jgi:CubicO group peptidase (beta-lactamase class C family)
MLRRDRRGASWAGLIGLVAAMVATTLMLAMAAGSVPMGKPEEVGLSGPRLQRITEVARRHVGAGDVAGAVNLVARRGRIAYFEAEGMQDIASKKPMPRNALFRLASMSKPITGVAILMLVEEGKVRLSDPVSRFIPEFATLNKVAVERPGGGRGGGGRGGGAGRGGAVPPAYDLVTANRAITVRDLLTHGSGLVSGGLGAAVAPTLAPRAPADTLATYIPKLAAVPLDFQPGTLWRYSGSAGFDALSRVVEVVSGQPYEQFLRTRLFDPLGMPDTGFGPTGERLSRLASIYTSTPNGLQAADRPPNAIYHSGAGGLISTAEDYLQFAQMLLNKGELNGRRYLSPRTVALMTANHTGDMVNGQFGRPARGMGFGLSVQVVQDHVAADLRVSNGAYGWAGGTGVSFWIEPAEEMVSIFMVQGGSGGELRRDVENAVRQAIVE